LLGRRGAVWLRREVDDERRVVARRSLVHVDQLRDAVHASGGVVEPVVPILEREVGLCGDPERAVGHASPVVADAPDCGPAGVGAYPSLSADPAGWGRAETRGTKGNDVGLQGLEQFAKGGSLARGSRRQTTPPPAAPNEDQSSVSCWMTSELNSSCVTLSWPGTGFGPTLPLHAWHLALLPTEK